MCYKIRPMKKILLLVKIFLSINLYSQELPTSLDNININALPENFQEIANNFKEQNDENDISKDSPKPESLKVLKIAEPSTFGFNYIKTAPTSINTTSDLPVPNDYVISLRDEISIILSGSRERKFNLSVDLDGSILFPEIGSIQVAGDTYDDLQKRLTELIQNTYVGVNIDISLKSLSARKVSIIGAINTPGTYLVNPFTTVSGVLAYSGGVNKYTSLRNIKVLRNGKEHTFDLYDLLINGDRSKDISLQQGDVIVVGSTTNFITISGEVLRPMTYEYKKEETLQDIIKFAMGVTPIANKKNVSVIDFDKENLKVISKSFDLDETIILNNFNNPQMVEVFSIATSPDLEIRVFGPLENTGYFNSAKYENLADLIVDLKFSTVINPYIGIVENTNNSKLFSLNDKNTWDINLSKNSKVFFYTSEDTPAADKRLNPNSSRMLNDYILKIQFRNGVINFPVFGEFSVSEIVSFLGLDLDNIEEDKTTYIAPLEDEVIIGSHKSMVLKSKKFHSLSFRFQDREPINVTVIGEAQLPGNYILSSSTTLYELYNLLGGLKVSADQDIVIFSRESVKLKNEEAVEVARKQLNEFLLANLQEGENINPEILLLAKQNFSKESLGRIAGDFSLDSPITKDFFLQDGDVIRIPKKVNSVSVIGEVLQPLTLLHNEKYRLNDYIEKSGGFKQFADKRSIYVIRADGKIDTVRNWLFRKNLEIYVGDVIVVPRDIDIRDDWRTVLLPITQTLSNLAFASASLNILENNN